MADITICKHGCSSVDGCSGSCAEAPKSFHAIRAQMLQLRADALAFHEAHKGTGYASDAVAGLCDVLSDLNVEFEAEIPTSKDTGHLWATTSRVV